MWKPAAPLPAAVLTLHTAAPPPSPVLSPAALQAVGQAQGWGGAAPPGHQDPAGHSAPLLLAAPRPQNEPGADAHAPEQTAEATGVAPLVVILKPQPTCVESETNLTHTGLGTEMAGVAPTPG